MICSEILDTYSCPGCGLNFHGSVSGEKKVFEYELIDAHYLNYFLFACPFCKKQIVYLQNDCTFWELEKEFDFPAWKIFSTGCVSNDLLYFYNPLYKKQDLIIELFKKIPVGKKYDIFIPEFMVQYVLILELKKIASSIYLIPSNFYLNVTGTIYPSLLVELNISKFKNVNWTSFYYTINNKFDNLFICNDFEILKQEVKF